MSIDSQAIENYLNYCRSRGVTDSGLIIVRNIITNPPARRVRTRSMSPNITSRFPSRKMGFTIQAESRTLELASIYLKEFDPKVIGYWDQPFHKADLIYTSGKRNVRVQSTLDFFVISEDFIGYEECKPYLELQALVKKNPGRYQWNSNDNCFEIAPLRDYLKGTGITYRIVTDKSINPIYIDNLAHLYDYLPLKATSEDKHLWKVCADFLKIQGATSIQVLEQKVKGLTRSSILQAIAQQTLHVDLQSQSLAKPEDTLIAADAWQQDQVNFPSNHQHVSDTLILEGSATEIEVSLQRYKLVNAVLKGENIKIAAKSASISERTLQRWLSSYRKSGLDGLRPNGSSKGNYGAKLPATAEQIILDIFESEFIHSDNKGFSHIYGLICGRCNELDISTPSKKSVRRRLDYLDDLQSTKIRKGAKSAYQLTAYEGITALHGQLPMMEATRYLQRCHIDHTQIDLQLVSVEGVNLGKPWLTTIVDEHTGFVLSLYLTFNKPSSVSVMSALRLLVMKHGVFPEAIVADGGKEFQSIYFETLMARYCVTVISREGKPRAGGPAERAFGTLNTIFLDNLSGSNKLAKNIRQLSASHLPQNLAIWEPVEFYQALTKYIDTFNHQSIKAGGMSPASMRDKSIERFGLSAEKQIKFDHKFLMNVLIPPKRKGTTLRRNETIQINRVNYWHICLKSIPREGVSVDVRYDPFDLNYIFVYHKNAWMKFQSSRPQHQRADELDSAIIAEVTRQTLYVNEKAKDGSRTELALLVEDLNDGAKLRHAARTEEIKVAKTGSTERSDNPPSFDPWSLASWNTSIPDSDVEI